jgi:transposase
VEQFEGIRRDSRDQGMSIRGLARRHGVHRRMVRQALVDATPPPRKVPDRQAPATGRHVDLVRRWLIEDLKVPRKQRHTARKVWQRLVEEQDAQVGESTIRNLVARLRTEIGANRCQVMAPQTHPPAEEAEVDFGEFAASIAGQVMKLYMFCMRLSHSGKAFHFGYANQTQESFLDGHVRAFEAFGAPGAPSTDSV